ncbi:MAG: hypothetical protein K8F60_16280 [Melioribacteraceae bacterium]|nr:hypothetical protein [Melioribacteraceae bacterium]
MSDRITRDIQIKLHVEGKEVVGTLSGVDEKLENINKRVKQHSEQYTKSTGQMTAGTGQMNIALGQLGFLLGDADMFMTNFRMGMMSIANNIPMVVQQFSFANKAISGTGQSIKDVLLKSLSGPGGLMLAVGGLTTLMNILATVFDRNRKEIKETAKETNNLAKEIENLGTTKLKEEIRDIETVYLPSAIESRDKLIDKRKALSRITPKGNVYTEYEEIKDPVEYEKRANEVKALEDRLGKLKGELDATSTKISQLKEGIFPIHSINDIKEAIKLWNIELETVNTQGQRDSILKSIEELKELEKQFRNDVKPPKESDIKKRLEWYTKQIAENPNVSKADLVGNYEIEIPAQLKPIPPDKIEFANALRQLEPEKTLSDTVWATTQISAVSTIGYHIQSTIGGAFRKVFGEANSFMGDLLANISTALLQLATNSLAQTIWSGGGNIFSAIGSFLGLAQGGYVTGAGTSTSDSIPAMLSNGEFVVNAKSTTAFRPLLEAINSFDRQNISPIIKSFSQGGLVGRSSQVIALAGNSPGQTNINLTGELKVGLKDIRLRLKRLEDFEKGRK